MRSCGWLQEKVAAAAKEKEKGAKKAAPGPAREKDPDPDGAALAAVADPLAQASSLLRTLRTHAPHRIKTHLLSFEVSLVSRTMCIERGWCLRSLKN